MTTEGKLTARKGLSNQRTTAVQICRFELVLPITALVILTYDIIRYSA